MRGLFSLRSREPGLRRGEFSEVLAEGGDYPSQRILGAEHILAVLNGSDRTRGFAMPIGEHAWRVCSLEDLIGGGMAEPAGSEASRTVGAFGGKIVMVN
ncbi:hypothetical protein ACYOEI_07825 [Singulisphaera rosea]